MRKAVLFDRDGTLNHTASPEGHGYVLRPEELILFEETKPALRQLRDAGILPFVFTQQGAIGKGLLDEAGLRAIHDYMQNQLGEAARIEQFYHCPHTAEQGCDCRKPQPGMIHAFLADYGFKRGDVIVVGDSLRDYKAAEAAGVDFVFLAHPHEKKVSDEILSTRKPVYNSLLSFVKTLC